VAQTHATPRRIPSFVSLSQWKQCPHCYHNLKKEDPDFDAMGTLLNAIPETEVQDAGESKNRTYCCGAGGGCFWKEEVGGTRINEHRLSQLTRTNSETVAVGYPFCMTMLEDAVKARSLEGTMRVRDLTELVAAAIDPEPITNEAKTPMSDKKMI